MRYTLLLIFGSLCALSTASIPARTTRPPSKPIVIFEPFGRGGGPDLLARALAPELSKVLHRPVEVQNVVGGGATAAPAKALQLPPDGDTLLINTNAQAYSKAARTDLDYDPIGDFIPVRTLTQQPYVLVTGRPTGLRSIADLNAAARTSAVTFGSTGIGTGTHIGGERLNLLAGLRARHVPPGATEGITDVLANAATGKFTYFFAPISLALPAIRTGDLVALGVSTKSRSSLLPATPSISEAGVRRFDFPLWYGIWVRSGTPADRVARLNLALAQAMATPTMRDWLRTHGAEPLNLSQRQFRALIRADCSDAELILKSGRC
jgi:tripartite-type tricarboxylate transporter receptor subunit TctC